MKVLAISASVLDTIQTCVQKYDYSYNLGLTPVNLRAPNTDLEKGDLVHIGLAEYYRAIKERRKLSIEDIEDLMKTHAMNDTDLNDSDIKKTIEAIKLYMEHYSGDDWEPLEIEKPFAVVLYGEPDIISVGHEDEDCRACTEMNSNAMHIAKEGVTILLQGKTDLIVKTRGRDRMIVDHKKEDKKSEPPMLRHQNFSYMYAMDTVHFCINYVGLQNSRDINNRFHRHMLPYTRGQVREWRLEAIAEVIWRWRQIQEGWIQRNITSCFKYGRVCEFLKLCEAEAEDRPTIIKTFYTSKRRKGLWSHEESKSTEERPGDTEKSTHPRERGNGAGEERSHETDGRRDQEVARPGESSAQ